MSITHKVHAHGELLWWLILLSVAAALTGVLAREAHGSELSDSVPVATAVWSAETHWG